MDPHLPLGCFIHPLLQPIILNNRHSNNNNNLSLNRLTDSELLIAEPRTGNSA